MKWLLTLGVLLSGLAACTRGGRGGGGGGDEPPADPCADARACDACTEQAGCGWCGGTGSCRSGSEGGPTAGTCADWAWVPADCAGKPPGCDCDRTTACDA